MPTALPAKTILNGADNPTTSQMKTALGQLHDNLSEDQARTAGLVNGVLTTAAGTAAAPSLTTAGDTNTGLYFPAADTVAIATGGVKRVEVDASGNFGLGVTPSNKLDVDLSTTSIQQTFSTISADPGIGDLGSGIRFGWGGPVNGPSIRVLHGGDYNNAGIGFSVWSGATNVRAITLDASGNLLVGYTTSNGNYKLQVNSQIFATSSTIATSDGRYKENITPLDGALNLVKELNPVQFSWKKHPVHAFDTDIPTVGFIAQELQQVLSDRPYLNSIVKCNECTITAAEYETIEIEPAEGEIKDEDGNVLVSAKPAITEQRLIKPAVTEEFLGIAEGNLIAILTKAIQEQQAIIEAQKTAIESLTDRIAGLETICWYLQTTR